MINSIEQYRVIDLCILSILAVITEVMGQLLHIELPGAGFHLSFSILICIIAIFRWNEFGSVVCVMAGVPMIVLGQNSMIENFLLYPLANCTIILTALVISRIDKEEVLISPLKIIGIIVLAFGTVSLGKGFVMFILEGRFIANTIMYFLSQSFTMIMSFMVLLIVKRRGGLLVDMKKYFEIKQLEEQ